ncbi:N-acetylneuraminate epimerase [Polystyrenella longa]|uniref:N-acetylneuraminate epimerase n=1 Tax=Polystyrenella longa TaxID=2528007 RepID=A0A518CSU7_9PLAN|nr:kelch repeat-containing protein [Polystyrenella longa]QDU82303.1 N-acetylneuraminate epimerase [Polystyrenella longa]
MKSIVLLLITFLSSSALLFAEDSIKATPKKGVKVAPELSEQLPSGYEKLPLFGEIEWEVKHLPWVEAGPYAGISGLAMVEYEGEIYVAGGFIPGGETSAEGVIEKTSRWTWKYNPRQDRWSQLPHIPDRREYTRGIVQGSNFYVVGGGKIFKGQEPSYQPYPDCFQLDLSSNESSWKKHSQLNVPRTHTSIGSIRNKLLVVGGNEYQWEEKGYSHNTIRATTEVFDLSQPEQGWQVRSSIPTGGRGWAASVVYADELCLFGGVTWKKEEGVTRLNESWRYDPQKDDWSRFADAPVAISGWEGTLYQNRYALIAGGVAEIAGKMVWSDLCWAYDCEEDRWLRLDNPLPPGAVFNDPGVVIIEDTIYIIGAEGPSGSHYDYLLVGKIQPSS